MGVQDDVHHDVEVGTNCEHSHGSVDEWDLSKGEECDLEWMDAISNERERVKKCAENNAHSKKGKWPMSYNEHGSNVEGGTEARIGAEAVTQKFEPYG
uniref:Uncharacterized protein n=1 Tax=Solanum lycopersicum TaxID=4081 RepID=A0A3Q7FJT3_SOLLC